MEKFRTTDGEVITKYKVIKETDKQITYINKIEREVRENKESSYHQWHNTFDDAKNFLIEYNTKRINNLETQLFNAKEILEKVQDLKFAK